MTRPLQILRIAGLAVFLLGTLACGWAQELPERKTHVTIEGDPPTFTMTGSGDLSEFTVFDLGRTLVWYLKPAGSYQPVEKVRTIHFGVPPVGYYQSVPRGGGAPAAPVPGEPYTFQIVTGNAPGTQGVFEMMDGHSLLAEDRHDRVWDIQHQGDASVIPLPEKSLIRDFVLYGEDWRAVWRITRTNESAPNAEPFQGLVYGEAPAGYKQVIPKPGIPPPPLESNASYEGWLVVNGPDDAPRVYLEWYWARPTNR